MNTSGADGLDFMNPEGDYRRGRLPAPCRSLPAGAAQLPLLHNDERYAAENGRGCRGKARGHGLAEHSDTPKGRDDGDSELYGCGMGGLQ